MGYRVEFAGIKLHEIGIIEEISTSILPKRNNFTKIVPSNNGSLYNGFRYEERIIKISMGLPTKTLIDYEDKIKELASVLNVDEPSSLKINDSNIIYYAIPQDESSLEKKIHTGKFRLTFVCHDIYGYDKNYSSLTMKKNMLHFDDVKDTFTYPILGFTFSKSSSFVYLVNNKAQALMIGREKNNTKPTIDGKTRLIDDDCTDSSTFTQGGKVTVSDNRVVDGTFGVGLNGSAIIANTYGTDVEKKWVGTTFRKNIDTNLDEFEVKVNMTFSSHGKNYTPYETLDMVRVARKSGIFMHTAQGDDANIIGLIPYGTDLKIIQMGDSAFCTVRYENRVGWINTKNVWRINHNSNTSYDGRGDNIFEDLDYAEDQMGLMEVLGFDDAGQLLFRFHIRDDNKFFEHVIPEVYIVDEWKLGGTNNLPTPFVINYKDEQGRYLGEKQIASGVFGDWNDYTGTFTMRRKKLENGDYRWWASITRTLDGVNITQIIHMGAGIIDKNLPESKLNHLVFYIAKYDKCEPVSVMAVNHIGISDISNEGEKQEVNTNIFKENDYLEIDFDKCEVTLNGEDVINELDIGSQFFKVDNKDTILVRSDDENLVGVCSYKKRYL